MSVAKAGRFVYRGSERTAADISRKASEGSRDFDTPLKQAIPTFKPKEGENCIRIMPSTWAEPDWDMPIQLHYNVGPDSGRYLCLKMKGGNCPVCNARLEATDKDEADSFAPRKAALCWIIDRDNEKAGPQIWYIPFSKVRNEIYARSVDKKTKVPILIDDPEEGYDIVFSREGTGDRTNYKGVEIMRDPTPLHDDQKQQGRWLEYIAERPLDDILNFYEVSHIEKVLFGKAVPKAEEDETETASVRSSRTARRVAEEPDEAEEEPVASNPRRASAAVEEEEPPFETEAKPTSRRRALLDANDEEPEPTPTRRGRAAPAEEQETPDPVRAARASLERLKQRQRPV